MASITNLGRYPNTRDWVVFAIGQVDRNEGRT